jgi:hypothetical protein
MESRMTGAQSVLEVLERERLTTAVSVNRSVREQFSATRLAELDGELLELAELERIQAQPESDFLLLPNDDIAGGVTATCLSVNCRMSNLDNLARFSAIWADQVYLPPYFGVRRPDDDEEFARDWLAGSLEGLLRVRPLLQAGIVRLLPRKFYFCEEHGRRFEDERIRANEVLEKAVAAAAETYVDVIRVNIRASWAPGNCYVVWEGPEEIFPEGSAGIVMPRANLSPALRRKIPTDGTTYAPSRREVRQSRLIDLVIRRVGEEVLSKHLVCHNFPLKYMTNRDADRVFLAKLSADSDIDRRNALLAQLLTYQMPIIRGVPMTELLRIREAEREAFVSYRDSLSAVFRDYVRDRPSITGRELSDVYQDIVRPQVDRISLKLKTISDKANRKLRNNLVISGCLVGVGLLSREVSVQAGLVVAALGGANVLRELGLTWLGRNDETDVKEERFYFLWKVQQSNR